jgi:ATP-dependent Lhr-like helicase
LLERESLNVSWYELGRVYRRLEARGEIRGGYFVGGVGGEQFALPEAIGLLRSIRKLPAAGELVAISGADPLNLAGILTPGGRVASIASNRLLLRDGVPIASLEAGAVHSWPTESTESPELISRSLRLGRMPKELRPYYA